MTPLWLLPLTISCSICSEIPIGVSDFPSITRSLTYIDKSRYIKTFLEDLEHHAFITCPKGFGKTVNMNMIKHFTELIVDEDGTPVDRKSTDNYKLFTDFTLNLQIVEDRAFFDAHFGKYPVLYLNFNDTADNTSTKVIHRIGEAIRRAYFEKKWLLRGVLSSPDYASEREKFQNILDHPMKDEKEILRSIPLITSMLGTHFERTILLLIDEYDTPVMRSMELGADIRKIIEFLDKVFYLLFVKDAHIGRVLCTGVFHMALAEGSSHVKNMAYNNFLDDHSYTYFCGFSREEVYGINQRLNDTNNKPLNDVQFKQIDKYFHSYNARKDMTPVYNPYDILNYYATKRINNYWIKYTSIYGHKAFFDVPHIKQELYKLLWDKELEFEPLYNATAKDLEDFMKIGQGNFAAPKPRHTRLFLTYLLELGYLSYTCTDNVFEIVNRNCENELILRYHQNNEATEANELKRD